MKVEKDQFVNAGMNYIFQLDQYPVESVKKQVLKELDELLELNKSDVLLQRKQYIGMGKQSDYVNRVIETHQGNVIAGIRHVGGNRSEPFVYVWPSFKIVSAMELAAEILPYFEIFNPQHICYWSRPDCNKSNDEVIQQRFIGRIDQMLKGDLELSRFENYYEWYAAEYEKFHKENPEFVNRISVNSKQLMDSCQKEDLLFFYVRNNNRVGLIAGESGRFLDSPSIYLNEILIHKDYRNHGYAIELLASFVSKLNATYFLCDIDSQNITSTKTALRSGQQVFSQELFARI